MTHIDLHPEFMLIGRVIRPHGIRGELVMDILTDMPQYFDTPELHIGPKPENLVRFTNSAKRFHQGRVLVKLQEVNDRDYAENLRQQYVFISRQYELPLEEGEFYLHQLIGMQVIDEAGELLGEVTDTIQTGANDVFVVNGAKGEILIPDIEDVVLNVDRATGRITVHLLPGLLL